MAQTAKQRAASKRNIKKAQAALRRKKRGGRKSSTKRRKSARRARRAGPVINVMPTVAAPRRRRRASAKRRPAKRRATRRRARRSSGRRRSPVKVVRSRSTQTIVVTPPPRRSSPRRRAAPKRRKRTRSRRRAMLDNPMQLAPLAGAGEAGYMSLFDNPVGPFSMASFRALGSAAAGIGIGLVVAEFADRWVATRGNKHPWYGRDAAAAIQARPDAMRLGVQAGGAALAMAGAYYARGRGFLPWLLGGIAIGFASNLVRMGLNYYVMPAVLTVENPTDKTLANRIYPLEQTKLQDTVTKFLEEKNKAQGALEAYAPGSPLDNPNVPAAGVVYLGKARRAPEQGNALGAQPKFVATGALGKCGGCGGQGGCWTSCPEVKLCKDCGMDDPVAMRCKVVVEAGDDIVALAASANVDLSQINALNGGGGPETYWVVGNTVTLPYAMCAYVQHRTPTPDEVVATPALAYPTMAGIAADDAALLFRAGT